MKASFLANLVSLRRKRKKHLPKHDSNHDTPWPLAISQVPFRLIVQSKECRILLILGQKEIEYIPHNEGYDGPSLLSCILMDLGLVKREPHYKVLHND